MTKKIKNKVEKTVLPKKPSNTQSAKKSKTTTKQTQNSLTKKPTALKTKTSLPKSKSTSSQTTKKNTDSKKSVGITAKNTKSAPKKEKQIKSTVEKTSNKKATTAVKPKEYVVAKQNTKESVKPSTKENLKSTKNKASKKTSTKKEEQPKTDDTKNSILPPIQTNDTSDYDLNKVDLDFENEVYDEADIASALEMGFIAQALEAHKAKVAKETHPDFDGESCIDCGEEIPQLRLSMGRIRCVYCQEALERKNKLHGR